MLQTKGVPAQKADLESRGDEVMTRISKNNQMRQYKTPAQNSKAVM